MKFNYRFLLISIVLIYSCKKEDIKTSEDFLTQAPWKINHVERTVYVDYKLDTVYMAYDHVNDVLTFNNNSYVNLTMNIFNIPLSGKWMFDANKEYLTTNLHIQFTAGLGFFYYPYNRIIRLNDTELILEYTSLVYRYHNGDNSIDYVTNYVEKSFFTH